MKRKNIHNKAFWIQKLSENVERDKQVNDMLTEMGWIVLRFWETDIKHNLSGIVEKILSFVPASDFMKNNK